MSTAKQIILANVRKLEDKAYRKERDAERLRKQAQELKDQADKLN